MPTLWLAPFFPFRDHTYSALQPSLSFFSWGPWQEEELYVMTLQELQIWGSWPLGGWGVVSKTEGSKFPLPSSAQAQACSWCPGLYLARLCSLLPSAGQSPFSSTPFIGLWCLTDPLQVKALSLHHLSVSVPRNWGLDQSWTWVTRKRKTSESRVFLMFLKM
jgi:hypothetical protein